MKYPVTTDNREWTDRDIIVTLFSDGTACPRRNVTEESKPRTSLKQALLDAETWLSQERIHFDRVIIHLMEDAKLPDFLK